MKRLSEILASVAGVLFVAGGVALTAMVFLTGADVVLRYFGKPIVGTYEIVGLLGALMVGFALPQTSRAKGHVLMDFIITRLPSGLQKLFYGLTRIFGIFVFGLITWEVWLLGDDYRRMGEGSLTLAIPLYPVAYVIAICSFVVIIVLFLELVEGKQEDAEQ
jgi:TRAP-type C4-dicarboxylate transport system permease small subunit